jgi:SecD/SecF fusion protein
VTFAARTICTHRVRGVVVNRRSAIGLVIMIALLAAIAFSWGPFGPPGTAPLALGLDLQGGLRVVLQASGEEPSADDLRVARSVIERRINALGVAEPLIQTSGADRIVVELPGLTGADTARALALIGQQAVLEFRLVARGADPAQGVDALEDVAFTGEILADARADFERGPGGLTLPGAVVHFAIQREFADAFGAFTGGHVGRRMAIVLDGRVMSAPTIQSRISDQGQITGMANLGEATDLALVLRSGSLPIALHVAETRAVGPSLGADSVRSGTLAAVVGALAVLVAVVVQYGPLFGGALSIGLAYVMVVVLGTLAALGAVLTLPGIAGLVLTIGAAVDGNVISFERIKEELRTGKGLRVAMRNGFRSSLSAIVDANLTTLFAAAALYQYTSGPVRGFAVTLAIGVIGAVFLNTVVVPWMLDVVTMRVTRSRLPRGFGVPSLRFLPHARRAVATSAVLLVASAVLLATNGLHLSNDFTGGTTVHLQVPDATTVADVREALGAVDIVGVAGASATVQEMAVSDGGGHEVSVRVGALGPGAEALPARLEAALPGSRVLQSDFVGPAIGEELRTGAWFAVSVALVLTLTYLTIRFWPTWIVALSAVLATIHDVVLVLGVLALTGTEFSVPVLAALLFVVGYSLNDSIVIADRIREDLRRARGAPYAQVVEGAVHGTLSRTVMTSFTTLLPILALLMVGGPVLRDFSLVLLIGVVVGVYSSLFVMAPSIVWFDALRRVRRVRRGPRRAIRAA